MENEVKKKVPFKGTVLGKYFETKNLVYLQAFYSYVFSTGIIVAYIMYFLMSENSLWAPKHPSVYEHLFITLSASSGFIALAELLQKNYNRLVPPLLWAIGCLFIWNIY